jgi:hypothetical protein
MTSFINFFNNYLPPFLITISILYLSHSLFLLIHQHTYEKTNQHASFHVHEMYIKLG